MAELMLLIQHRAEFNPKRLVGSSVIGILAFLYSVWTIYGSGAQTVLLGFLLLLLGLPVYVWLRKQQAGEVDAQQRADKNNAATPPTEGNAPKKQSKQTSQLTSEAWYVPRPSRPKLAVLLAGRW